MKNIADRIKERKLTAAEKKLVRDSVVCAIKELLAEDRLIDLVWDALDGCANELCYNDAKQCDLNDEVHRAMDKVIGSIK